MSGLLDFSNAGAPPWLPPAFAALFGLVIGSFLNVVILRLPLGKFFESRRSRCPACGAQIAAYDNLPVLSYVLLLGRCRRCKAPISLRYPTVELAIGAASLASLLRHGPSAEFLVELAFVASMVALVFIDYDHKILPNVITLPGAVLGLGLAFAGLRPGMTGLDAVKGCLLGAGFLFAVAELYFRVRKVEGLGFGDVKMMGMVGAFLGWRGVLLTLFLGSLSGSLIGAAALAKGGADMQTKLPFGTFLGLGAVATVYVGGPLIGWYSGLF